MMNQKYYRSFTAKQFREDPFFIEWIRDGTPESGCFWEEWISRKPDNLAAMREAEWQLRAVFSVKPVLPEDTVEKEVWERIENSIANKKSWKQKRIYFKWAAAAVVLFAGLGFWIFMDGKQKAQPIAGHSLKENNHAPGGNKAVLTLGNGARVTLDSAQNGAISIQGNTTAVKLNDGELSYQKSGKTAGEIIYNTVATPRGGQYQLTLSDGTKVWLNAESSLHFPTYFGKKNRVVQLKGEGYFEVAADMQHPFVVKTEDMQVEVLGTHFNINAYKNEATLQTTLLEGKVKVSALGQTVMLIPGQQTSLNYSQQKLIKVNQADMEKAVAWKNGYFSFREDNIETIMRQFARWYNIKVQYEGKLPKESFTGKVYRNMNLEQVLEVLKFSHYNIKLNGNQLTVSAN